MDDRSRRRNGALACGIAAMRLSPGFAAVLFAVWAAAGCADNSLETRPVRQGAIEAPRFPFAYEDLGHPLLARLRLQERLDDVVRSGESEFAAIVRLRQWAHSRWSKPRRDTDAEPYPNALEILRRIRSGDLPGGHCSEYAVVFVQACLAMGHQARLLSLESGTGAGHRSVEVWSNEHDKWVLMDPLLDSSYEREGVPLSALELHRALGAGAIDTIRAVPGPAGELLPLQEAVALYRHITVIMRTNHLSLVDPVINRYSLGLVDESTDGRPTFSQRRTRRPEDLYWRLNQTVLDIRERDPARGTLTAEARTNMPGFASFEARSGPDGAWRAVSGVFGWPVPRGESTLEVRAVNLRGVAGPPAIIAVTWRLPVLRWPVALAARRLG